MSYENLTRITRNELCKHKISTLIELGLNIFLLGSNKLYTYGNGFQYKRNIYKNELRR